MLGSQKELRDATKFCEEHKLIPQVSHVLEGLENAPEGYDLLNTREQFGKVVVKI
jgi:NADPH-dependent curcumin reductase CurA